MNLIKTLPTLQVRPAGGIGEGEINANGKSPPLISRTFSTGLNHLG